MSTSAREHVQQLGGGQPLATGAVRIIRTRGCRLAITVFALEAGLKNQSTCLTAHWQPQQVQRVSLSKRVPAPHFNSSRNLLLGNANWRAKGETNDFKSSHCKRARWFHCCSQDWPTKCSGLSLRRRSIRKQNNSFCSSSLSYDYTTTWICCMLWDGKICNKPTIKGIQNRFYTKLGVFS